MRTSISPEKSKCGKDSKQRIEIEKAAGVLRRQIATPMFKEKK